jgi:hypothetical protein
MDSHLGGFAVPAPEMSIMHHSSNQDLCPFSTHQRRISTPYSSQVAFPAFSAMIVASSLVCKALFILVVVFVVLPLPPNLGSQYTPTRHILILIISSHAANTMAEGHWSYIISNPPLKTVKETPPTGHRS